MAKAKQQHVTTTGAVELEETKLDDVSGGDIEFVFRKIEIKHNVVNREGTGILKSSDG
jgi:hypothetical protein